MILATVTLAALHLAGTIDLEEPPLFWVDLGLHIALWTDYLVRFLLARDKGDHFKRSFDELVALLPFSEVLTLLHIFRLLHMLGLVRLLKRLLTKRFLRFAENVRALMNTNGFCFVLCGAVVLLLTAAFVVCKIAETPYWTTLLQLLSGALHGETLYEIATALFILIYAILAATFSSAITCFSLKRGRLQTEERADRNENNIDK